ncbi:MAG: DNA polymerase III subunit delta [Lachnospiraceae bacterium]|nr:DNA polymerase III subunit delta [Lachnospiraceae bacterium]
MQGLLQDIKKNEFGQIYLLFGEEAYLRKQYRDRLRQALIPKEDTMNCHYFEGKHIQPGEIIDLAETLPFFAGRRVILLEDTGWFQKGGEQIAEYLGELCETTCILFVEEQIDKRSKLYKAVKKYGRIAEFKEQDETTLKKWIFGLLQKEKKQITTSTMNYLLERVGTDMSVIKIEVEKLLCYCMDKEEVTVQDVDAVCTRRIQNQIFDMMNSIAAREQKKALKLYYDLLTLKEPPMRILALLGRQFNLLLQVKELRKKGYPASVMAKKTGLHEFVVGKYIKQAEKFKTAELRQALEDCVQADEQVKKGIINDRLSVELLICNYSAKQSISMEEIG